MIQRLWRVFLNRLGRSEEEADGRDAETFVPSPLDLSVRIGHGGRDDEVARELSKIDDRAAELEDARREE
ncbi:hypothetical protein [Halobellus clavatus]|jgi:hypothetical protein|uniref:Uncharacterized protein n=1 Tax=Halobellus clavatus TaxID=660517 RepID=A0A1H3HXQ7_9EURY|nr:hypothetical protein [Halobellus clavatus]SDY20256.1 hypothetical protein SAMN04487946_108126 [Halobellus clavatus]